MGQRPDEPGPDAEANKTATHHTDLGHASTQDLVDFIGHLAGNANTVQAVAGRLIAEVLSRGVLTIRDLETATGVARSTLARWAAPFKPEAAR